MYYASLEWVRYDTFFQVHGVFRPYSSCWALVPLPFPLLALIFPSLSATHCHVFRLVIQWEHGCGVTYESTGTFPVAMLQTSLFPLAVINCLWILPYHVVCWWGQSWAGNPSCEFRSATAISTLEDSFPNTPPLLLAFTSSSFLLWFPWAWRRWYRYPIWKWAFRNNHSSSCLPSCEVLELLLSLAKQRGALDDLVIPEGELTRTLLSIGQDNSSSFPLGLVNSLAVGFPPGFYYQTWSPSCLKSNKK